MPGIGAMQDTIEEYEASCRSVQQRIHQLNEKIAACPVGTTQKLLISRRARLYLCLWDMQYAIREMAAYIR
ncbi:hypothetical protein U6B65_13130 [Oscillospiraceae bacterium MB08-C2-2]|nr:hypothetical protein U6B65_13130 [Oscillospiraceae bacterium MB08-C2-2]